jgi:hypothetical protein
LATVPGPNAIDPSATDSESEDRRFQRLERVRALQRSRRHRRLVLIATLVLVLAAGSVLGFAAVRRTSSGNVGGTAAQPPVISPTPDASSPAVETTRAPAVDTTRAPAVDTTPAAVKPGAPARADTTSASEVPAGPDRPKAEVALPRRAPPEAPPAARVAPSISRETAPRASAGSEPSSPEAGDHTAAIDWLLGGSRAKGQ